MELKLVISLSIWIATTALVAEAGPQGISNSLRANPSKVRDGDDPKQAKIMKQINKVNEDGSYTFGYEADDGSFRVETRSKDGVVKGKYGYVDSTGQLKIMEYVAGEKTEDDLAEDEDEPLPPRVPLHRQLPSPQSQPLQLQPQIKRQAVVPGFGSGPDQAVAAQTNNEEKIDASSEEDNTSDNIEKDVNNGQYFRAVPQQQEDQRQQVVQPSPSPSPQGPPPPRYVPSHHPGPQQGLPGQYAGGLYSSPLSGQSIPSSYGGGGGGPSQYQPQPLPPQFISSQARGLPTPNVQIQFRGSPPSEPQQYQHQPIQQPQQQGGFPGSRQVTGGRDGGNDEYVPNIDLDGFSEDADEDGYVDDPPTSNNLLRSSAPTSPSQITNKGQQSDVYRPQILGPQGSLQGGQVGLGLGPEGNGRGQGGGFQQLSDDQIQQLFNQQQQFRPQGGQQQQGLPPQFLQGQYFPGQGQGQGQGQFLPPSQGFQGFSPQQLQQAGFGLGSQGQQGPFAFGRPGAGGSAEQRPGGNFGPQQNSLLQDQYQFIPTSGQGSQQGLPDQFSPFPPGAGQGGQFPQQQQYFDGPQFQQGGSPQQFGQYPQGLPPAPASQQGLVGSSRPQPQQLQQGGGGRQGQVQGGGQSGLGLQSAEFPFDFNPFGSLPGGPSQGFQGSPQFPPGFAPQQQQFQGQPQLQGFAPSQGLSPQQFAALQNGGGGGFPQPQAGGPGPQIQGFVPGRFPSLTQGGFGGPDGPPSSSSPSGAPGGRSVGLGLGIQLGGGQPRPVQAAEGSSASLGGGIFSSGSSGLDDRKQLSSSSKVSASKN